MYLQKMLTPYPFHGTINTDELNRLTHILYERIFHMSQYDLIVFVGRFQPPHIGHMQVCQAALNQTSNLLILTGSANRPATPTNPWSAKERESMLYAALRDFNLDTTRVIVRPLNDQTYNDQKWVESVQIITSSELDRLGLTDNPRVGIIGHDKDESSYYLKMFPQWDLIPHAMNEVVHATDIRKMLFEDYNVKYLTGIVTPRVVDAIVQFKQTDGFKNIVTEYNQTVSYKKSWAAAPYPPTFVTADALVVQSGHVLLVTRKHSPGMGLLAMCGGFVDQHETIESAAIRELREETRLKVPTPVLKGSIVATKVYDAPNRSTRGRTITHVFLIVLPPGPLPSVKGGDDASAATWVPLASLESIHFFEDHYDIIQDMLGKV